MLSIINIIQIEGTFWTQFSLQFGIYK